MIKYLKFKDIMDMDVNDLSKEELISIIMAFKDCRNELCTMCGLFIDIPERCKRCRWKNDK